MSSPVRRGALALLAGLVPGLVLVAGPAAAAPRPTPVPAGTATIAPGLKGATGSIAVMVQMSEAPIAATVPDGAIALKTLPSAASQRATTAKVVQQQAAVTAAATGLGGRELAAVTKSLNAVAMQIDARQVDALAKIPGVISVRPVLRYSNDAGPAASGSLAQAAQYLTADGVRAEGFDGTGVRVAVLDSGIDYTHFNLGGPGTPAAYDACYTGASGTAYNNAPVGPCADLFGPGHKIVGGYDFVGETWPTTPEQPDPNPIDSEGHGTHVSDILGGRSADGTHLGLAPGVSFYAVKVCSAVATSCSGIALTQGVDFALDPNGDGDMSDAVDLMNLSLGSDYGGRADDLAFALDNAVRAGVSVVVSAGNGSDRPFKVGQPSIANRVISVAQTTLPDDVSFVIKVNSPTIPSLPDNSVKVSVLQDWGGSITSTLAGNLGRPVGPLGCTTADFAGFAAGRIALVTRGSCAISVKASTAQAAGATGMILVNNTFGLPPSFSYGGGGTITIPVLSISQSQGTALVTASAAGPVVVTIDPAQAVTITNTMVGTSSRGPSNVAGLLKPDIGAPGAWLSAEVGTGSALTGFGGTSGAAPTVAGVAALLIDKYPANAPLLIKSRLLNGADTNNTTPSELGTYYPTPISRIGAGEVRALASADATTILRYNDNGGGNIALGIQHIVGTAKFTKTITLRNVASSARSYTLSPTFRDAADAALGAVSLSAPSSVTVPAGASKDVTLTFQVIAKRLDDWPLTYLAGLTGNDGTVLNGPEIDGNLVVTSNTGETVHLGWQILPHKSATVSTRANLSVPTGGTTPLAFKNPVAPLGSAGVDAFSLLATSPKLPRPEPGQPGSAGSNVAIVDLAAVGVRDSVADGVVEFAIAGYGRRPTPLYPAGYEVDLDTNRDGTADYYVFPSEIGGFGVDGRSAVYVQKAGSTTASPYFITQADYDSGNLILTVPLAAVGLVAGQSFDATFLAYDNYFSGLVSDATAALTYTLGSPKFTVAGGSTFAVGAASTVNVDVQSTGSSAPSSETGLLFLYADAGINEFQATSITLT